MPSVQYSKDLILEVVSVEQFTTFRAEDLVLMNHVSAVVAAIRLFFGLLRRNLFVFHVLVDSSFHSFIIICLAKIRINERNTKEKRKFLLLFPSGSMFEIYLKDTNNSGNSNPIDTLIPKRRRGMMENITCYDGNRNVL